MRHAAWALVAVILVAGCGDAGEQARPAATPTATLAPGTPTLVVIGDSLAVGMRPYLSRFLPGWRVIHDARSGRRLAEGMARFDAAPPPDGETVYAFSLFTNDRPGDILALEVAVRRSTSWGCALWATIARPPVDRRSYEEVNERLRRLAAASPERLRLVEWAAPAERGPGWLKADRIHGTPTGYRNRAALYAAAAKSCSS